MKKDIEMLVASILAVFLLISVVPTALAVNLDNYPRMDNMIIIDCADEAAMITKAQAGEIDTAHDIRSPDNVALLEGLGWSISTNLGYGFHYWGINCRDVTPETSGKYFDYHGRTPGVPLFPLNISEFRYALHLLIGGEVTDQALSEVFGWTQVRIDTIPSPAAGFWYNDELPPFPHDPAQALDLLASIGITNSSGYWENTNPDIGPVGELRTMYMLGCPEAIESTTAMSQRYFAEFNKFFGKKSDGTSDYWEFDLIAWTSMVDIIFGDRDCDVAGLGWSVGRDPDYLFDFFHSSKDAEWDYNWPGIRHPELDELLYAVKYWRYTNGTYITTLEEMIEVAHLAQEYLYYLQPYMVTYCEVATSAYAPGLKSWIESLGYGSWTGWTDNWLYWTDMTTNTIRTANPGPPDTLNPGMASSVYEWEILGNIYDGLYAVEPFLHEDVMWTMSSYTIEEWSEPAIGVEYGQAVHVTLRPGIYWHDGDPVTSDDIKWNFDFIKNIGFARYSDILLTYWNTTVHDDYHFTIYMNCTGIWTVYTYFGSALIFREKVWAPFWDDKPGAEAWEPWTVDYDDWMLEKYGEVTDTGDLKCLVGTGPWIFIEWDAVAGASTLVANRPDAVWTGNPGWFACLGFGGPNTGFVREDLNFDGVVDVFDAVILAGSAGATPEHPRWNYGRADITADYLVDIFDAVRLAGHAGWITLPPPV